MSIRIAFVDDIQAAKDFATGDIVRRMGYRELLPGPFAGRVIYSNPRTGKIHVQWPWGAEEEPATELIRDLTGDVAVNGALDQIYTTWESARHTNGEASDRSQEDWFKDLLKKDPTWKKKLAATNFSLDEAASLLHVVSLHEQNAKPVWRSACKAWHDEMSEIEAFTYVASLHKDVSSLDTIRITVSNIYETARNFSPKYALYWKDSGRKYKVTKKEKDSGVLFCPSCRGKLKARVYRKQKKCLQCADCGFSISPKDLVWESGPASVLDRTYDSPENSQ